MTDKRCPMCSSLVVPSATETVPPYTCIDCPSVGTGGLRYWHEADLVPPREVWKRIRPQVSIDTRTRSERQLARALLLLGTIHLLKQEDELLLAGREYEAYDRIVQKRLRRRQRCLKILEQHYHL